MGTEIERKFLVDVARLPREALREGSRFVQGYLSLSPTVRVRVSERPGLPTEAWITVKGPGGLMRAEFEYAIPVDDARAMVLLCVASLRKTRFRVLVGDHVWDQKGFEGDACEECFQFMMVRNGTCLKCMNCGATSGCS